MEKIHAGQTDLIVGTKIKIKLPNSDEDYKELNGKIGTITHPFAFGETSKNWLGVYLDEKSSYGEKININIKHLEILEG